MRTLVTLSAGPASAQENTVDWQRKVFDFEIMFTVIENYHEKRTEKTKLEEKILTIALESRALLQKFERPC